MKVTVLKIVFSFSIITYLVQNGFLEFSSLGELLGHPESFMAASLIIFLNTLLSAYRWKILVANNENQESISHITSVKLTWIGLFFNTVLPGAVSGDIVKYFYLKKAMPLTSKSFLAGTVLLDRVLGLVGLIVTASLFSIIYYRELALKSVILEQLLHGCFVLCFVSLTGFIILLYSSRYKGLVLKILEQVPKLAKFLQPLVIQIFQIATSRKMLLQGLFISVVVQLTNIYAFWLVCSPFFETAIDITHLAVFVPLGLITIALPVSPAGLGVGHAAFSYLFGFLGQSNGASLFNLYFFIIILNHVAGIIPYIITKNNAKMYALKEGEQ